MAENQENNPQDLPTIIVTPPATLQPVIQDPQPQNESLTRGRRITRSAINRPPRHRSPSPATSRTNIVSPTSSYASASYFIQPSKRITVTELRKLLGDLGIHAPRNLNKPELLKLYNNATSDSHPSLSPSARPNTQKSDSRYTPYTQHPRSQTGKRKSKQKHVSSHTPSEQLPQASRQPQMTSPPTLQQDSNRDPNNAIHSLTQPGSTPFYWPPAPPSAQTSPHMPSTSASHFNPPAIPLNQSFPPQSSTSYPLPSFPTSSTQPTFLPPSSLPLAHTNTEHVTYPTLPSPVSSPHPPFTLYTATPLPPPQNALAMEPPPVSSSTRNQILAGADIDLFSLLSPITTPAAERQVNCGDFTVTLKPPSNTHSRTLSLAEFSIAFARFTDVICSVFPHRRRELNDYMAIIAELALSYGGTHFYTYHKLFSAKCAIRLTQWNQISYWGAVDLELHNRVFLGCRNLSCAVCRSILHPTTSCPFITLPSDSAQPPKSTSYVPRPPSDNLPSLLSPSSNRPICQLSLIHI